VAAIGEDGIVAGGQRSRHEAQLHEGPHADRQQEIHDAVGIKERVEELIAMAYQCADIVAEQTVKANVLKAQFVVTAAKLLLPVSAKGNWSMTTADGVFPDMRQRRGGCRETTAKMGLVHAWVLSKRASRKGAKNAKKDKAGKC